MIYSVRKTLCYFSALLALALISGCVHRTAELPPVISPQVERSPTEPTVLMIPPSESTFEKENEPTKTAVDQTRSPESSPGGSSLSPTPSHQCQSRQIRVTSRFQNIYRFWWSAGGQALYVIFREVPGTHSFDLIENTFDIIQDLTYPEDAPLPAEIAYKIPDTVERHDVSLSPSGVQALYGLEQLTPPTPGPTPTINTEGLTAQPGFTFEIYLVTPERTEPLLLGTIDGLLAGFVWSPDESKALVRTSVKATGEATVWMVNLSDNSLSPLFFATESKSPVSPSGISPDGKWILYDESPTDCLRMKNLINGEERELTVTSPSRAWWLSTGDQVLLLYRDEPNPSHLRLFWFDLETEELIPASDHILSFVSGEPVLLSPDETKVAYMKEGTREVFVLTLCPIPR